MTKLDVNVEYNRHCKCVSCRTRYEIIMSKRKIVYLANHFLCAAVGSFLEFKFCSAFVRNFSPYNKIWSSKLRTAGYGSPEFNVISFGLKSFRIARGRSNWFGKNGWKSDNEFSTGRSDHLTRTGSSRNEVYAWPWFGNPLQVFHDVKSQIWWVIGDG